jgi:acyl-CoA thioester hydrolase
MTAEANGVETVVPLRWRDMDAYGHVNHAVFLTYLEQGRDAALTSAFRKALGDSGYVVARVAIDYRRELTLADGPVVVTCRFTTIGSSSLRTRETIVTNDGVLAAEAGAVIVSFDRETRSSRPWSGEERAAFMEAGAQERE